MVYLITCRETQTCKIGYSKDPYKRVLQLQTSNPFRLELESVLEGDLEYESFIHRYFKKYRLQGEWFKLNDEILTFFNVGLSEQDKDNLLTGKVFDEDVDLSAITIKDLNLYQHIDIIKLLTNEHDENKINADLLFKCDIIKYIDGFVKGKIVKVIIINPSLYKKYTFLKQDERLIWTNLNNYTLNDSI